MKFYLREHNNGLTSLFYNADDKQFDCVANHQFKLFPPRLFNSKRFCFYTSLERAVRVAKEKNNWQSVVKNVHILSFIVRSKYINQYIDRGYCIIQHSELSNLNKEIIGYIEKIQTIHLT